MTNGMKTRRVIYVEQEEWKEWKERAAKTGISVSELIRMRMQPAIASQAMQQGPLPKVDEIPGLSAKELTQKMLDRSEKKVPPKRGLVDDDRFNSRPFSPVPKK